jgi:hypothetical protein
MQLQVPDNSGVLNTPAAAPPSYAVAPQQHTGCCSGVKMDHSGMAAPLVMQQHAAAVMQQTPQQYVCRYSECVMQQQCHVATGTRSCSDAASTAA